MSIRTELNNILGSDIYKLAYNGKVVGLRVKHYDVSSRQYLYYDFELSYVSNAQQKEYINKNSAHLDTLQMVAHNGVVCTPDEASGAVSVREFKDSASACDVLGKVILARKARA